MKVEVVLFLKLPRKWDGDPCLFRDHQAICTFLLGHQLLSYWSALSLVKFSERDILLFFTPFILSPFPFCFFCSLLLIVFLLFLCFILGGVGALVVFLSVHVQKFLTWFWTFPLWRVRGSYALPHVNLFCLNLLSIYLSMYFGRWIIFGFVLCVPVYCFPSLWFVTSNFKFLALIFFFISSPSGGFPAFVVTPP